MTSDLQQTTMTQHTSIPFGARLQSARETLGLERKDVAAQLRLNEKIIVMMEKEKYAHDLPVTFIRGYLRAYGKLLQIPEQETSAALEPIQPKPVEIETAPLVKPVVAVTSGNYLVQLFTCLVVLTVVGLLGAWWYTHNATLSPVVAGETNATNSVKLAAAAPATPTNVISIPTPAAQASNQASAVAPQAQASAPSKNEANKANAVTTEEANNASEDDAEDTEAENSGTE